MNSKLWHRTSGAFAQLFNVIQETLNRTLGLLDVLAYFLGIQPSKKLRLRVVILRDEQGNPVASEADTLESINVAQQIFAQANVRIIPLNPPVITVEAPSPTQALDVHCDDGAWQEDFDVTGSYFRRHMAKTFVGTVLGYAAPITVYVLRDISIKAGCSLGPLADYVTMEAGILNRANSRILAHEVGHCCGLLHHTMETNLMCPRPGSMMAPWQIAIVRNSRHVTYL